MQGCLKPIEVIIPSGSLLDPSDDAAVIGGNVLTCQRVVDVVFKAFSTCATSQGCMNNTTFGDDSFGYYETVAGGAGAVSKHNVTSHAWFLTEYRNPQCAASSLIKYAHNKTDTDRIAFLLYVCTY